MTFPSSQAEPAADATAGGFDATGGRYRISVDVGGTFTDVVVTDGSGRLIVGKGLTDRARFFNGIRDGIAVIAAEVGLGSADIFANANMLVYATTTATNAIVESTTACTALLVTEGFADTLVMREGGKLEALDLTTPYPRPYIPRHLTFEIPERITAEGDVYRELDEDAAVAVIDALPSQVEAVAVGLLWSVANPIHELRVGELLRQRRADLALTLSHQLNPIVREYRRLSSASIDASLKPLMQRHLREVEDDLAAAGFAGELLFATSAGGLMHLDAIAERPIYMARSGPSLAPVSARHYARDENGPADLIVCDTGGTSFDVGLIRDGRITTTRDTWLGRPFFGHMTGMSSVDVRSIGAGGGSIAWIDPGGLLRVGPHSAGSNPAPACYARGGTEPTVTDAAVALGYINPDNFAGGTIQLDVNLAKQAVDLIADQLDWDTYRAADAIMRIASQHMVQAIREITINEGIDPRDSLMVVGGGAGGLNCALIAAELGCADLLLPKTAGVLSACGGQFSDIVAEFTRSQYALGSSFDFDHVNAALEILNAQVGEFGNRLGAERAYRTEYYAEARYLHQIWELEVTVPSVPFLGETEVKALREAFHTEHDRVFGVVRPDHDVEILQWKARLVAPVDSPPRLAYQPPDDPGSGADISRSAYFAETGAIDVSVFDGRYLQPGTRIDGPAILEEATTTVVLHPGSSATVTDDGNYRLHVEPS